MQSIEEFYKEQAEQHETKTKQLKDILSSLSIARLLLFAAFIYLLYQSTQTGSGIIIAGAIISFIAFLVIVKRYDTIEQQVIFYTALAKYNTHELQFLQTNISPYNTGKAFEDPHHPYSYDLDIFGEGGLYAHLNRCSTGYGRETLAANLLAPDINTITNRQEAVKELAGKPIWRQQLFAHGSIHEAREKDLQQLLNWAEEKQRLISRPLYFFLIIFPVCTIAALLFYCISNSDTAFRLLYSSFILNLIIAFAFSKKITKQLSASTSVTKILQAYKKQLQLIEQEPFKSPLLQSYQQELLNHTLPASVLIGRLSKLFEYLESIINLLVSILLNGLFLFHIHILYRIGEWKKQHAGRIKNWLQLIGTIESLNSLANFSYNNPSHTYPQISATPAFEATGLGHPLIRPGKCVVNDVSFNQQRFVILTGSNMSGKSTFLRTLGSNLVLARAGSVVCATQCRMYPFDIFVSMRITDSLQSSESFFYAELKRLQSIIQYLQQGHITFIILDEILRGTNSNDKRNGTIGLIKKMAAENTFGIIATHDVMVADLIRDYPGYIANKAFESEIVHDELLFDFKLRDGVCTKLSASYLMKKLGVIDD